MNPAGLRVHLDFFDCQTYRMFVYKVCFCQSSARSIFAHNRAYCTCWTGLLELVIKPYSCLLYSTEIQVHSSSSTPAVSKHFSGISISSWDYYFIIYLYSFLCAYTLLCWMKLSKPVASPLFLQTRKMISVLCSLQGLLYCSVTRWRMLIVKAYKVMASISFYCWFVVNFHQCSLIGSPKWVQGMGKTEG